MGNDTDAHTAAAGTTATPAPVPLGEGEAFEAASVVILDPAAA
jgi:hypothetical protein